MREFDAIEGGSASSGAADGGATGDGATGDGIEIAAGEAEGAEHGCLQHSGSESHSGLDNTVLNNIVLDDVGFEIPAIEPTGFLTAADVQGTGVEPIQATAQSQAQSQTAPETASDSHAAAESRSLTDMESQPGIAPQLESESQRGRTEVRSGSASRASWRSFVTVPLETTVRLASRLLIHGGGAFPGRIIERIDHGFLSRTLAEVPQGVVMVAGAYGASTARHMIVSMLENLGLRVFSDVVPAAADAADCDACLVADLLGRIGFNGRLAADIVVLELNGTVAAEEIGAKAADTTHAARLLERIAPRYALLLGAERDRFRQVSEIGAKDGANEADAFVQLLGRVAQATTDAVVLNREDARVAHLATLVPRDTKVAYFGMVNSLRVPDTGSPRLNLSREAFETTAQPADVVLKHVDKGEAEFLIDSRVCNARVNHDGVAEMFDAAAALAAVRAVAAAASLDAGDERLLQTLA
jgi:hypothetical protein